MNDATPGERGAVLLVTYTFPPIGGPGVQRILKFAKYLPRYGWRPIVLTAKRVHSVVVDPSLLDELPADVGVVRTGTLDPARGMHLVQRVLAAIRRDRGPHETETTETDHTRESGASPGYRAYKWFQRWALLSDTSLLWLPFAVGRGVRVARRSDVRVVVGSCPGPSSLIAALLIGRLSARPVVYDFRDGWLDYPYLSPASRFHLWVHQRLEALVIPRADGYVVFGEFLVTRLAERYGLDPSRFVIIPNGFDPSDFPDVQPARDDGVIRLVHSGNVSDYRLGPFETFAKAFSQLDPEIRDRIRVDLVGNVHPTVKTIIEDFGLSAHFRLLGYLPHQRSVDVVSRADAGIILLPITDQAAVTGKIFEYIGAGLPVIGVCSRAGGAAEVISTLDPPSVVASPDDPDEVDRALSELVASGAPRIVPDSIETFTRAHQTGMLARVLSDAVVASEP